MPFIKSKLVAGKLSAHNGANTGKSTLIGYMLKTNICCTGSNVFRFNGISANCGNLFEGNSLHTNIPLNSPIPTRISSSSRSSSSRITSGGS